MSSNVWALVLERIRGQVDSEEFRRWFGSTAYASDSGDLISVWVPTETDRRHLQTHYRNLIEHTFALLGRQHTQVRFLVTGVGEEEDDQ
jgi:chromosomal replication initiation ATPase DnaA